MISASAQAPTRRKSANSDYRSIQRQCPKFKPSTTSFPAHLQRLSTGVSIHKSELQLPSNYETQPDGRHRKHIGMSLVAADKSILKTGASQSSFRVNLWMVFGPRRPVRRRRIESANDNGADEILQVDRRKGSERMERNELANYATHTARPLIFKKGENAVEDVPAKVQAC